MVSWNCCFYYSFEAFHGPVKSRTLGLLKVAIGDWIMLPSLEFPLNVIHYINYDSLYQVEFDYINTEVE